MNRKITTTEMLKRFIKNDKNRVWELGNSYWFVTKSTDRHCIEYPIVLYCKYISPVASLFFKEHELRLTKNEAKELGEILREVAKDV